MIWYWSSRRNQWLHIHTRVTSTIIHVTSPASCSTHRKEKAWNCLYCSCFPKMIGWLFRAFMAMLLRKVWGSVSNRSDSVDRDRNSASSSLLTSLGAFDELPSDILMQILRKLGAKDAIKMSVVCKSWKLLVSDNQLWIFYLQHQRDESWDSIYFAETSLRPGYPLQ